MKFCNALIAGISLAFNGIAYVGLTLLEQLKIMFAPFAKSSADDAFTAFVYDQLRFVGMPLFLS